MNHSFLVEPGHWQARGTLFDAAGHGCPLAGNMDITHDGECWHNEAALSMPQEAPIDLSGTYDVVPLRTKQGATSWRSLNSRLGELQGHIAVVGEVMISGFSSADHQHSGASYLRQISRDRYHNRGYLISNGILASSWHIELLRING